MCQQPTPWRKPIKAKTIVPAEMQVMVISAAGMNPALPTGLFQDAVVLTCDAFRFYRHCLLIPSLASQEECCDLSLVQADYRCTNQNVSVLVSFQGSKP
jgi:hypothetical protein